MGVFRFKQFDIDDSGCGMKICSDSVLLAAWFFSRHTDVGSIADIGAGSGLLSLMGALICPDAVVTGIEIDASAATAARRNFAASPWSDRLRLIECDFSVSAPSSPYDLIISNPPYFSNGEQSSDAMRAKARHQQGLTYHTLINYAAANLSDKGHLGFVSPETDEDELTFHTEICGLKLRRIADIVPVPGRPVRRRLWDICRVDGPFERHTLSLKDADGHWSEQYLSLVEPYYLKI